MLDKKTHLQDAVYQTLDVDWAESSTGATQLKCFEIPPPRVAMIGAARVGTTLDQRLLETKIADGVLLDIWPGIPQGIALDWTQAGEHSV